ncbi:MAG TPA: hypothetical protein VN620_17690 [Candidatus Methylomirabilis sp.]|nr:hypothetical protein [Candidatus Methylomirabilis sp.]
MAARPQFGISVKGTAGLIVAVGTVVALLVFLPAYRIFFAISLAIAAIVAVILYFWHNLRPVRPEDVEDKRPLKLK